MATCSGYVECCNCGTATACGHAGVDVERVIALAKTYAEAQADLIKVRTTPVWHDESYQARAALHVAERVAADALAVLRAYVIGDQAYGAAHVG